MNLTKKQEANLEYSYQWLTRAKKDFAAFKKLVPFDKKARRVVRYSDPALAVYLLQQSIEKAIKAVVAASGQYSYRKLRGFSHNSLRLLLDFYTKTISLMLSHLKLEPMFEAFGLDAVEGLDKLSQQKAEAKKTEKSKAKKRNQAVIPSEVIDGLVNFLLSIRDKAFLESVRSVFGPHGKIKIDVDSIDIEAILTGSPQDFVDSTLALMETKLNIPNLSEAQKKPLFAFHKILKDYGILESIKLGADGHKNTNKAIELERGTDEWLGQWSMLALILLAFITFPHESTSRYPVPKDRTNELGCQDYDEKLGIVNRLGQLGYVVELAIDEIKPQLETIADFFSKADKIITEEKRRKIMGSKGRKNVKKPKKAKVEKQAAKKK
jgi:hypothetical protein